MALLLVLAVCPLMAWRRSSMQRVGNTLVVPGVAGIGFAAVAAFLGVRLPVALFGFAVCVFVAASTILDVGRAVAARHKMTKESAPLAFVRLISKHRRRYGGYVVHLSMIVLAMGLIGSTAYQVSRDVSLMPGQSADLRGYRFQYVDYSAADMGDKERYVTRLDVYQGDHKVATLNPERNYYYNIEQWVTEVGIQPSLAQDIYVSLSSLDSSGQASFSLQLHPLVTWLWIGGGLMFLGAVLAMWPSAEAQRRALERRPA
jgi:cytochrome c-type biogenesis protein CcmF